MGNVLYKNSYLQYTENTIVNNCQIKEPDNEEYFNFVNKIQGKNILLCIWIEMRLSIPEPQRALIVIENENNAIDLGSHYHYKVYDSDEIYLYYN